MKGATYIVVFCIVANCYLKKNLASHALEKHTK